MKEYPGRHVSTFPLADSTARKHREWTKHDLILNFGDVVYVMPEMVLHYLDDEKALGWESGWKPPQEFIDKVMEGGEVKFAAHGSEKYALPVVKIGYLMQGEGEHVGSIVDTHHEFNDMTHATVAEFGAVPEGFIERMKQLYEAAIVHYDRSHELKDERNDADTFVLPPAPGYRATEHAPPEVTLSYADRFELLQLQSAEAAGVKVVNLPSSPQVAILDLPYDEDRLLKFGSYNIAKNMSFFMLNADTAVAKIDLYSESSATPGFNNSLHEKISAIFAEMGVETDVAEYPYIKVSGERLNRLKQLGAEMIELNEPPTLTDKIAVLIGKKPLEAEASGNEAVVRFEDTQTPRMLYDQYGIGILQQVNGAARGWGGSPLDLMYIKSETAPVGDMFAARIESEFAAHNFITHAQQHCLSGPQGSPDGTLDTTKELGRGNAAGTDYKAL